MKKQSINRSGLRQLNKIEMKNLTGGGVTCNRHLSADCCYASSFCTVTCPNADGFCQWSGGFCFCA